MLEKFSDIINITNFTLEILQILVSLSQEVIQIFIYYLVEVQPVIFFSTLVCKIFVLKYMTALAFSQKNID